MLTEIHKLLNETFLLRIIHKKTYITSGRDLRVLRGPILVRRLDKPSLTKTTHLLFQEKHLLSTLSRRAS
jgi:hypothetical protein